MDIKKILLLSTAVLIGGINVCSGMQSSSSSSMVLQQFLQKYAPPQELMNAVAKQKCCLSKWGLTFSKWGLTFGTEICGYISKGRDVERLINTERMRACKQRNKLSCLDMPHKCICQVDGHLVVFAKKVNFDSEQKLKLTFDELNQLVTLTKETAFVDWNFGNNWVRDLDTKKLVCIDMENGSFKRDALPMKVENIIWYLKSKVLEKAGVECDQEQEVAPFFEKYEDTFGSLEVQDLSTNPEYDKDIGIDFEAVKKELSL